jgi:NitT/TauT family transport system substrate-binding protein
MAKRDRIGYSIEFWSDKKADKFLLSEPTIELLGRAIRTLKRRKRFGIEHANALTLAVSLIDKNPVATKRALRAILKSTDLCASDPVGTARRLVEGGFATRYDYALQTLKEIPYNKWREYDPEDTLRFYALRLREAGMIKSNPNRIIAESTDWRFLNELKRELKG